MLTWPFARRHLLHVGLEGRRDRITLRLGLNLEDFGIQHPGRVQQAGADQNHPLACLSGEFGR